MFKKIKDFFTKPEILVIVISQVFTLFVSTIVGVGGYLITNRFWGYFIIAFGLQFIIFAIINTFLQRKDLVEGAKILNKQLEELSKFTVRLTCSYCQHVNTTPIVLNQENRFKCESCNQINGIKMQFFSTQLTIPLSKVVLPVGNENIDASIN